jgi:hypothetical protein
LIPTLELDPLFRRDRRISILHAPPDLDSAPDGISHTLELGQKVVAGILHDLAPVLLDLRID